MKLAESLADEKLGLKESAVAKIVSTFNTRSLKECCSLRLKIWQIRCCI